MNNRDQQNRFLQPIQDSDRQGDRNPRVFLKAKVIPASSQPNPDRYKILKFLDNRSRIRNLAKTIFRKYLDLEHFRN